MRTLLLPGLLLGLLLPQVARAEWLPLVPRAIPQADFASRDVPAFEAAYGPKPQLDVGGEVGLFRKEGKVVDFRLSAFVLVAFENGQAQTFPPFELGRVLFGVNASDALKLPVGLLEWSIGLGREQSFRISGPSYEPAASGDIPFGGGGSWLDLNAAWQWKHEALIFTLAADDRVHLPSLVRIFSRTGGDAFADVTADGLNNEPAIDATVRWPFSSEVQPLASLHVGLLVPGDDAARLGYFTRLLLGAAFHGPASAEAIPFVSVDVGNGLGLLINRREARFSIGVRLAPF